MTDSFISSIRYKDISDDQGDIAVTKFKCPVALIRNRQTDFEFERHCQLFVDTDNETLAVAGSPATKILRSWQLQRHRPIPRTGRVI
jgi:hypothetical protein